MSEACVVNAPHILHELSERLAVATTQSDVLRVALAPAITALGAVSGTILLLDETTQVLSVESTLGLDTRSLWHGAPVTARTPAGDAIVHQLPLYFEAMGALHSAYPEFAARAGDQSAGATAVVPLRMASRVLGVLILEFSGAHEFSPAEQQFLATVAAQTATGLDRTALLEQLSAAESRRPSPERTTTLTQVQDVLATTLDSLGETIMVCDAHGMLVRVAGHVVDLPAQDAASLRPDQWAAHSHLYRPDLSRPLTLAEIPLYRAWHGETVRNAEVAVCRPGCPPQYALVNGQPLLTPEGEPAGAVVALRDITPLYQQASTLTQITGELRQERAALQAEQAASEAFIAFTEAAGRMQTIQELGDLAMTTLQVMLPGVTALFYEPGDGAWYPVAWTPDIEPALLAVLQGGLPADTPILAQMMATRQPVFLDSWIEAEQGVAHTGSYHAVAAYPILQDGAVTALLSLGLQTSAPWTEAQRRLISAIGRSFTLLHDRLSSARQVQEQRDEAETRSQALQAFAEMARDLSGETDRYVLVRRAQEIMLSLLTPGYALYWELAPEHWALRSQVGDIGNPELQRLVDDHGLPLDAPALQSTWLTGVPNYQDNYAQGADTPAEMIRHVNAATAFRVMVREEPVGMLAIGLFDQRVWTPMDRVLLETAIYSLGLILERAQGVEALEQMNAELRTANEELQAFAYSVSHDLRTPVRHVKGFVDLALKALGQQQLGRAQRHLGIVSAAADRMTEMIDAMLSLSRAGRSELVFRPVQLQAIVQQAQRDALLEFPAQSVTWHVGSLPSVRADATTLQQVVTNLLSNAVKFATPQRPLHVRVWAEEHPHEWAVFVQDNGTGFDERYTGKLFGAFQRLHTHEQFAGTGVGLATIKRIITRHGGRVWAEGQIGVGATFGFTLPKTLVHLPITAEGRS